MEEEAIVESVGEGKKVRLQKNRPDACGHCASANICGVKNSLSFWACNETGEKLEPGQKVVVRLPSRSLAGLAAVAYGVPTLTLVGLLLFFLLVLHLPELASVGYAFLGLAVSFFVVRLFDARFRKTEACLPVVVKISRS
ncbi:MAG TPA: SoxR reducing system RseC family protein [Thermotogota bacterium]|nr:SoxR reducing system RseC family protein [Thermotogota bacterium]HRW92301.1 SoxR reducing system RseC family protein [Thermotogota bacterium]